jgi:hypothetical protein
LIARVRGAAERQRKQQSKPDPHDAPQKGGNCT